MGISPAIALNVWKSPNSYSILGVKAMWVEKFGLIARTLDTKQIFGSHTHDNLIGTFIPVLESYNLSLKSCIFTIDRGTDG